MCGESDSDSLVTSRRLLDSSSLDIVGTLLISDVIGLVIFSLGLSFVIWNALETQPQGGGGSSLVRLITLVRLRVTLPRSSYQIYKSCSIVVLAKLWESDERGQLDL